MFYTKTKEQQTTKAIVDITTLLNSTVEALQASKTVIEQQQGYIEDLTNRVVVLEKHLTEYLEYKKKKESEQPFIEVISESFDEKEGLQIKLDWNEAMINYLRRNGYRGTDDEIIEKYTADLFNEKSRLPPQKIE